MDDKNRTLNKQSELKKSYTIGLDIGTNSVGWAVTDNNFNLVRGNKRIVEVDAKGKTRIRKSRTNLWGARLFETAQTAAERRIQRGTRRRLKRRKERLVYLRQIFEEHIGQFDDSFFMRLEESFYQNIDVDNKKVQTRYPLFHGTLGTGETYAEDKTYHAAYPTIYHLRQRLMQDTTQADLRLVYLAMHHILKFRGHFIYEGQKFDVKNIDVAQSFAEVFSVFTKLINERSAQEQEIETLTDEQTQAVQAILTNRQISNSQKAYELFELLSYQNKDVQKQQKALYAMLVGNGIDLSKLFNNVDYNNKINDFFPKSGDFKYAKADFDEKFANIASELQDEEQKIILLGKRVYEAIILSNILTKDTLSESMVEKYDDHKEQLAELKAMTKAISVELYEKIFKGHSLDKIGIYQAYIEGVGNPAKTITREDFYKEMKKAFEGAISGLSFPKDKQVFDFSNVHLTEEQKSFLHKMNYDMQLDRYLLKQRTSDNAAIPYQIHESELRQIIENQKQYYPFLGEEVTLTRDIENDVEQKVEYKIIVLMKFRIPYYVGPLAKHVGWVRDERDALKQNEATIGRSENSWVARKSDEKLTPWNFDEVIDKEVSALNFIERMTSFCSYLPQEKALPKNSLLYQEYTIYNELASCGYKIKEEKTYFSPELKRKIVEQLFKKEKKVTAKKMRAFLEREEGIPIADVKALFGIDTHVKNPQYNATFASYRDLVTAGFSDATIEEHREKFEAIIKWQTIFEDKNILKKTISDANTEKWDGFLSPEQIENLSQKHYTGWGRLSQKLLNCLKTANGLTIIEELKQNPYNNFMRLLEEKEIKKAISEEQVGVLDTNELNYQLVERLAGSPAIKKGIWQSLQLIKELETYLGADNIDRIVLEMARDDSGGRTITRKKRIEKYQADFFAKTGKKLEANIKQELQNKEEYAFANERVYLYFLQNGKCMYSGQDLSLDALSDYEIDHIIPQTYIKDDSFDNKVLVLKRENQNKGGDVPSQTIIDKMHEYWLILAKSGQVSPKKLANLMRGKLTDAQKQGFINRQLVETRQITKHVANILTSYFKTNKKEIEILTPKASLTSQFRSGFIYITAEEYAQKLAVNPEFKALPTESEKFLKVVLHDKFYKDRNLNAYHHAHDAYLNAVVATYIYGMRPDLRNLWVYGAYQKDAANQMGKYVVQRQYAYKQLLSGMIEETWQNIDAETGEVQRLYPDVLAWKRDEVIGKIERNLKLRNMNIVKKPEINAGKFSDESIYQADKKAKNYVRGLNLNPQLYGGKKGEESAFAVLVKNEKAEIKALSIPAMFSKQYQDAQDKIQFLKEKLYPKEHISELVRPQVMKYTKYLLPNGGVRLLASYQEASNGTYVPMIDTHLLTSTKADVREAKLLQLNEVYNSLAKFIQKNKLFAEAKLPLLAEAGLITQNFMSANIEDKQKIIAEMFRVVNGSNQHLQALSTFGLGTTAQQLTKNNTITNGTIIIDQSITGLYETRHQL